MFFYGQKIRLNGAAALGAGGCMLKADWMPREKENRRSGATPVRCPIPPANSYPNRLSTAMPLPSLVT